MLNALTIDVEDYFQVHAFSNVIRYEDWGNFESRVERNTDRILGILDDCRPAACALPLGPDASPLTPCALCHAPQRATFFVLGWIAERYPGLIREIRNRGHEVACHGYAHRLIYNQSREEFRDDVKKAKAILEDIIGNGVIGYRAPSYSITNRSLWALEILKEEGFLYDSSIFPIRHDVYGLSTAPRFPFTIAFNGNGKVDFSAPSRPASYALRPEPYALRLSPSALRLSPSALIEFPLSTLRFGGMNFPISGGGYFRLFPYEAVRRGLRRINEREGHPFIFYLHPWEFDPGQPRIRGVGVKSRFRHYLNLDKTEMRLKKMLRQFSFAPIHNILGRYCATPLPNSPLTPCASRLAPAE